MAARIKQKDAEVWLSQNAPHFEILSWPEKAKEGTLFLDKRRNVKFLIPFGIFKVEIKKNPDRYFSCSKKEFETLKKQGMKKKYGVENPQQNQKIRQKTKKTNLKRYGVECVVISTETKQKIKETNLRKYGVEKPFQSQEIQKKVFRSKIKNGSISTIEGKTLVEWSQNPKLGSLMSVRRVVWAGLHPENTKQNSYLSETIIKNILINVGLAEGKDFSHGKKLPEHKKFSNKGSYFPDFLIFKNNLIIECDGDEIHGNPKFYGPKDFVGHRKNKMLAEKKWKLDQKRNKIYSELGYDFLVFWEDTIKNNTELVEKIIIESIKF